MLKLLVCILMFSSSAYAASAHQHGHVSFEMAIDGMKGAVEIKGPGESFVGFEHKAKTKEEKKAVKELEGNLIAKGISYIGLADELECKLSAHRIDWIYDVHDDHGHDHGHDKHKKDDKHKGEHGELKVSYQFECKKMIKSTTLNIGLFKAFSNIKELEVAILPSSGNAFALELKADKASVQIP